MRKIVCFFTNCEKMFAFFLLLKNSILHLRLLSNKKS